MAANLIAATTGLCLDKILTLRRGDTSRDQLFPTQENDAAIPEGNRAEASSPFILPAKTGKAIRRCLIGSPYQEREDFLLWGENRGEPFEAGAVRKSLEEQLEGIGISRDEQRVRKLSFSSWSIYYSSLRSLWKRDADRHRIVVENAIEAICQVDSRGHLVFANPYATSLLGYSRHDELEGLSVSDLLSEASRATGRAMWKRLKAGYTDGREITLIRKDGTILYAKVTAAPLREDSHFKGAVVTANDIGDDKKALVRTLKRTERRLTDLVDKFPIAICALGRDMKVKYLNSPGENMFKFADTEKDGQIMLREHVPNDSRLRYDRTLSAVLERGETRSLLMDTLLDDDTQLPALWRFSPIMEEDRILGVYVAIIDIGGELIETSHLPSDTLYNRFALTDRERDISDLLLAGLQYKEIASRLSISLPTVRTHIMSLYRKMGIHSRDSLTRLLSKLWSFFPTGEG